MRKGVCKKHGANDLKRCSQKGCIRISAQIDGRFCSRHKSETATVENLGGGGGRLYDSCMKEAQPKFYANNIDDSDDELGELIYKSSRTAKIQGVEASL